MSPDCLPFSVLPHTPALFVDACANSSKVHNFYPHPPRFADLLRQPSDGRTHDQQRRISLSDILERENRAWGASEKTLANIDRFRRGARAMVTGQQVALFGGPLYAIYKALTAIKFAEQLSREGKDCVPVFWLATQDHDFAEVGQATLFSGSGLNTLVLETTASPNRPVGSIRLGENVAPLLQQAVSLLGVNEATSLLQSCYSPQETLGSAFARFFSKIFGKFGLVFLDPSHPQIQHLAAPIYESAISKAERLVELLLERAAQIEAAGYQPQVKVTNSSALLFGQRGGERLPIRRVNGSFKIGDDALTQKQLVEEIGAHPENFSPNVLLRPVVQDFLLPTAGYIAGPSEIAYFAQVNAIYPELLGRVTPIVPRFSATLIDPKSRRIMEQYGLTIADIFKGAEHLREQLAEHNLPPELDSTLEKTRRVLEENLAGVLKQLKKLDPTLVDAAQNSIGKVEYQLDNLRKKAGHAQLRRSEELTRHADHLSSVIYPNKNLQEREIAAVSFLARHGLGLVDRLYDWVQPSCLGHQVLYL